MVGGESDIRAKRGGWGGGTRETRTYRAKVEMSVQTRMGGGTGESLWGRRIDPVTACFKWKGLLRDRVPKSWMTRDSLASKVAR